jgi:hypothetical protein
MDENRRRGRRKERREVMVEYKGEIWCEGVSTGVIERGIG